MSTNELLDNNEKLFILDVKGKFGHVEGSTDKILAEAYALDVHQITDLTRKSFIRDVYSKLLKANILFPESDKVDLLMTYLTRTNKDPFETMMSDIRWLTADQMKLIDVYNCDMSILS